jgi:hypothetical protein
MFRRGLIGFLSSLSWIVTALAALNMGLAALAMFDFFSFNYFMMHPEVRMYTMVGVGFFGAWSLFGFVKHLVYCSGECTTC